MPIKTLFTVLTDPARVAPTLDAAMGVARAHDAHLDIMCLGLDATQIDYFHASASAALIEQSLTHAQEQAAAIREAATGHMDGSDVNWSTMIEVAPMADLARRTGAAARFADLAVLPQPYAEGVGSQVEAATEACLFDGRLPVLIVPEGVTPPPAPERVMIAWDDSVEAMAAVRAALPIIADARQVHVVIVDPPARGADQAGPGRRVSRFLARHGLSVEVEVLARTLPRVSDVLMRHATDIDAQIMVLGAYGHSRLREAMFGGTTRTMLGEARLPLLMAH